METTPEEATRNERQPTVNEELQSLRIITRRVLRLSPAGKAWLVSWLNDPNGGGA